MLGNKQSHKKPHLLLGVTSVGLKHSWRLILLCVLLLISSIWGATAAQAAPLSNYGPPATRPFSVAFTSTVSYVQALQMVTDLGLQPGFDCSIWQPMGQRNAFQQTHTLFVVPAYLTAPQDWFARLTSTLGVQQVLEGRQVNSPSLTGDFICPTASADATVPLNANEAGNYARVTFNAPSVAYNSALYEISNLGLQLADPCYERAAEQGQQVSWHPMGQENTFASSHTLIVQTNKQVTSSLWEHQLRSLPNVTAIETPFNASCGGSQVYIATAGLAGLGMIAVIFIIWLARRRRIIRRDQ